MRLEKAEVAFLKLPTKKVRGVGSILSKEGVESAPLFLFSRRQEKGGKDEAGWTR